MKNRWSNIVVGDSSFVIGTAVQEGSSVIGTSLPSSSVIGTSSHSNGKGDSSAVIGTAIPESSFDIGTALPSSFERKTASQVDYMRSGKMLALQTIEPVGANAVDVKGDLGRAQDGRR